MAAAATAAQARKVLFIWGLIPGDGRFGGRIRHPAIPKEVGNPVGSGYRIMTPRAGPQARALVAREVRAPIRQCEMPHARGRGEHV